MSGSNIVWPALRRCLSSLSMAGHFPKKDRCLLDALEHTVWSMDSHASPVKAG